MNFQEPKVPNAVAKPDFIGLRFIEIDRFFERLWD
jgi:hypothetical protein